MQISGFNASDYDEYFDNFTLIINRRTLIEMVEYYNSPKGIFHIVVTEIDPDSDDHLSFSRDNANGLYTMAYDPESAKTILDIAFDDKVQALTKVYSLAASYQDPIKPNHPPKPRMAS